MTRTKNHSVMKTWTDLSKAGLTVLSFFILLLSSKNLSAQKLTIDSCYALAKRNYPLVKQFQLIEKSQAYSIDNASKGYLPQLNIGGQATYQSAVTTIPISLPGMTIPTLSKDQYKIFAELNQSLTDPLIIKSQKELIKSSSAIANETLEVELFKIKERINQLYFGILMLDAQMDQVKLLKQDLQNALEKAKAAIANGISFQTNADLIRAEQLKAEQRQIELETGRRGYLEMLSLFLNQTLAETIDLQVPALQTLNEKINRPEMRAFAAQANNWELQSKLLLAKNLPHVSLFFQGGYGRPTLNLLNNDFGTYYIGGARLAWNLSGWYTYKKEGELQKINIQMIDVQKESFLFNTQLNLKQQNTEVQKLSKMLLTDLEIIALRQNIKNTASKQLENGTISGIDFLSYVNSEDQARQTKATHEIQLLLAQYNYQTTSGN